MITFYNWGDKFMEKNQTIKQAIHNLGGLQIAADHLGMSRSAVSRWIRNGEIPNLHIAKRVADESGFNLASLRPIFKQKISQS